jgi:hypothetical protein
VPCIHWNACIHARSREQPAEIAVHAAFEVRAPNENSAAEAALSSFPARSAAADARCITS